MPADSPAIYRAVAELVELAAKETATIDYDDMVWLPVRGNWSVGSFDTLFVDEAQDLSRVQQALACKATARLVVCGDRRQSLYGFAGSDCEALPRLAGELDGTDRKCLSRPLTVTFRCPMAHVELARKIVPEIEPAAGAVPGVVSSIDPTDAGHELMP